MSLPRFQNVRKIDGLGITLTDLLKELNDLRNRQPEKYTEIIEIIKPIMQLEYVYIFKDTFIEVPYTKILFSDGALTMIKTNLHTNKIQLYDLPIQFF